MAKLHAQFQDVEHTLQNTHGRELSIRRKLETELEMQISVGDYRQAVVTTEKQLEEEREELSRKLKTIVETIPFTNLSACVMPVLVTNPPTASCKAIDRASLMSYMLKKSLRYGWKSAFGRKPDMSPGQQLCLERMKRNMLNSDSPLNRILMKDKFGVELPQIVNRPLAEFPPHKPFTGPTIEHLTVPPKANRQDPQLTLPPIPAADARKGICSLIERRWIPQSANVTLKPPPFIQERATMYRFHDKFIVPLKESRPAFPMILIDKDYKEDAEEEHDGEADDDDFKVGEARVSVGLTRGAESSYLVMGSPRPRGLYGQPQNLPQLHQQRKRSSFLGFTSSSSGPRRRLSFNVAARIVSRLQKKVSLEPAEKPIFSREADEDVHASSRFLWLKQGRLCEESEAFNAFKLQYLLYWSRMLPELRQLTKLLTRYAVPLAIVHGVRLVGLVESLKEDERKTTSQELLSVLENREEVEAIVSIPGRQFMGPKGKTLAAQRIQASWRRHRDQTNYRQYQKLRHTVGVIWNFWCRYLKRKHMRQRIQETYAVQLDRFKQRAKALSESWERIQKSGRVLVHLPSMGYCESVRYNYTHFGMRQNTQMARLCEIKDPNVDVIYVAPTPMTDESLQYYNRLLGLSGAVESGRVEDQCDVSRRYKVLVPETVGFFASHRMCLASLLKYSPRTLRRISDLIGRRQAYVVPGRVHKDDVAVADVLRLPVLGPEPEVVARHCTKSASRDIFKAAGVHTPPGMGDIFRLEELYEGLTQLVLNNLDIQFWVLKLNEEFDGRGIACCDVTSHLTCYHWLQKEAERYGHQWLPGWAQEPAFNKVLGEIPSILKTHVIVQSEYNRNWNLFLKRFLAQGGVVEAYPHTGADSSLSTLTANFLLEPNGVMTVLCVGDQIHAESPLSCWGLSMPQSALESMSVNHICKRVSKVCWQRGLVGYVKMDLVTFISPLSLELVVWGIDLYFGYSDSLALSRLADYLTRAEYHPRDHTYVIPRTACLTTEKPAPLKQSEDSTQEESRFCVMSSRLLHSNLAMVHYPVFFQLCRASGIGYDIKEREGTVFTLIDNTHREQMGMITIGRSLQTALATFARHLCVIHEEVSTPNMQGNTNFKDAVEDIEGILDVIQTQVDEMEEVEADKVSSDSV